MRAVSKPFKAQVFTGSYAVGGNGAAANDFDVSDELLKYQWVGPVELQVIVARTAGASTIDLALLVSMDGGTTYSAWKSITQVDAASGNEILSSVVLPGGALIKTDINLGASTTATITVYVAGYVAGGAG